MASASSATRLCTTPPDPMATSGPPRASLVTSSPVADRTSGGPAAKIEAVSVMATKSHSGAVRAPWPAEAPSTRLTMGTSPDSSARPIRSPGRRPDAVSVTRCPAPSSIMTSGTRSWRASWHSRYRLSEAPLPIEPPSTVTSSAPARAGRPLIRPDPATRASRGDRGIVDRADQVARSRRRCPGSNRRSSRSRALSRPRSCWRWRRASPPMARASAFRRPISSSAGPHPWSSSVISPDRSVGGRRPVGRRHRG